MKPNVRGLENDDVGAVPVEPTGVDYSSPWHESYVHNAEEIRMNLHTLHPVMQVVLGMCQKTLSSMLVVDCSGYRWAHDTALYDELHFYRSVVICMRYSVKNKYSSQMSIIHYLQAFEFIFNIYNCML